MALPKNRSNAYISQPVADAFLARVYLYLEDWANAEKYASQVISQTDFYELVPISDWLANKQTKESIFELAYSSSSSPSRPSQEDLRLANDPTIRYAILSLHEGVHLNSFKIQNGEVVNKEVHL